MACKNKMCERDCEQQGGELGNKWRWRKPYIFRVEDEKVFFSVEVETNFSNTNLVLFQMFLADLQGYVLFYLASH